MKTQYYYIIGGVVLLLFVVFFIGKAVTPKHPQQNMPSYTPLQVKNTGNSMQSGVNGILNGSPQTEKSNQINKKTLLLEDSPHYMDVMETTNKFTPVSDWDIYINVSSCAPSPSGGFKVLIRKEDGSLSSLSGIFVNKINGSKMFHYNKSGTYYLEIDSYGQNAGNGDCELQYIVKD